MQTTMNHSDESHKKQNIGIKHDTKEKTLNMEEIYERSRGNDTPRKIYSNQ